MERDLIPSISAGELIPCTCGTTREHFACCPIAERAAIVQEATGCTWEEADAMAERHERRGQRALF